MDISCPNCETVNPAGAKFCLNCGNRLEAPAQVDGERKYVTVLFADVVDSTGLGERLDPEQLAEIMNGAFAFLNASVTKYGGTVARLLGDAIIAFFGAPVAHEDDAERAVRSGLEIQAAARGYAESVRRNYGVDFSVRVGINTGLAVLAVVGDEIRTEYTAMGDTTNVAARLQSAAAPGSVIISADRGGSTRCSYTGPPNRGRTVAATGRFALRWADLYRRASSCRRSRSLNQEGHLA